MQSRTTSTERHRAKDGFHDDLRRWKEVMRNLPVVRVEKVVAVRAALRHHCYDSEHIVAETAARVRNDVAILCR